MKISDDQLSSYLIRKSIWGAMLLFALLQLSCQRQEDEFADLLPAIRVKVLNGCGFSGVAAEFSDYLTRFNIDVVSLGNSEQFIYNKTIIVIKRDDPQDLKRLTDYTGIARRIIAIDDHSDESFQIIVGRDYRDYLKK